MTTQTTNQVMPLFNLGRTVVTPDALLAMKGLKIPPSLLLIRHHCGDWGDLDQDDQEANNEALENSTRIFSAYDIGDVTFWIITEADRSSTCILLPEEY